MKIALYLITMKTLPIHYRRPNNIFIAFLLGCILGATGCLSRPALHKQTFLFNAPAIGATNIVAGGRVLGIRSLQIAAPFDRRSLVYRTGEFSYVGDPYAEFLESPAEELMEPVRGWLLRDGNFQEVVNRGSALKPDTLVEINISQLFGDFREPNHPTAILTMRFTFFDAPDGVPGKVILQREYSRSIPLGAPSATALMKGWDQALEQILGEVSSNLQRPGQ
jgi:ABC-type uncharacterized transport system auxiliary subunit